MNRKRSGRCDWASQEFNRCFAPTLIGLHYVGEAVWRPARGPVSHIGEDRQKHWHGAYDEGRGSRAGGLDGQINPRRQWMVGFWGKRSKRLLRSSNEVSTKELAWLAPMRFTFQWQK